MTSNTIKTKTISIIVPVYNEERHLKKCLTSILNQSIIDLVVEILAIDGGSIDNSKQIVNDFSNINNKIKLLLNPKRNQASAFNIGVENSHGDIIVRMDAHTIYSTSYLYHCYNYLLSNPDIGNVGGSSISIPGSSSFTSLVISYLNNSAFGLGGASYRTGRISNSVKSVYYGAFPIEVIKKTGMMNEKLLRGEDNEYNFRIRKQGYRVYYCPLIQSNYLSRSSLIQLVKQQYSNGFSIGILLTKNIALVSVHHIVPMCFFLTLFTLLLSSFFLSFGVIVFFYIIIFYILVGIYFASYHFNKKSNLFLAPYFIFIAFIIHLTYGIGTIVGLIKRKYYL